MIVELDENGDVEFETKGFFGQGCKAVTEGFARRFGKKITSEATPEANLRASAKQRVGK